MIITDDVIAEAARCGASTWIIGWLRERPRTIEEVLEKHRWLARWMAQIQLPEAIAEELERLGFGRSWWKDGMRHRVGAPAIIWPDGGREWWVKGKRHREDGPAVEHESGHQEWWFDGYAEFVYLAATSRDNIDALSHLADGAAYPAIRPEVVAATPIVHPDNDLLERFASASGVLLGKMAANERESRTLAALRDALLPKLISGELRVSDADTFMERVAS